MIEGYPTWIDIADKLDLLICDNGPAGCRKKWGKRYHELGKVDQIGVIHWSGWSKSTHRKALRRILKMAAYGKNRQFREEPDFLGLYHACQWAYHTAFAVFRIRLRRSESYVDRDKVRDMAKLAGVSLKNDYPAVHSWVNVPTDSGMIYASKKRRLRDKKVT